MLLIWGLTFLLSVLRMSKKIAVVLVALFLFYHPQEGFPLKETVPTLSGPVVVRRTFPPLILASKGIWGGLQYHILQ